MTRRPTRPRFIPARQYVARHRRQQGVALVLAWLRFGDGWMLALGTMVLVAAAAFAAWTLS